MTPEDDEPIETAVAAIEADIAKTQRARDDKKLADAKVALRTDCPGAGSVWKHLKGGGVYTVVCGALIADTKVPAVVYATRPGGSDHWVLPLYEFLDQFAPATGANLRARDGSDYEE